jgi:hypothetical protein
MRSDVPPLAARHDGTGRRQLFPIFAKHDLDRWALAFPLVLVGNVVLATLAWVLVGFLMR